MAEEEYSLHIKVLMLGDSGVGKTCLLLRYTCDSFSTSFITTIGIDFKIKNVEFDGVKTRLQIWDTAGQEKFRTITLSYFKGAHCILLVYDITDRETFVNINYWMTKIKEMASSNISVMLVGNKVDIEQKRKVHYHEGLELAQQYNIPFLEVSAKTDVNVDQAFETLAIETKKRLLLANFHTTPSNHRVKLERGAESPKKGGCC